jgi:tRNA dimethylallyltransferase
VPAAQEAKPLVVILGPTGAGKTALALEIAERFQGEIVNCDSVQVYRGFDIGAAKLPESERRGIPHHLFNVAGPETEFTAGDYLREARQALDGISSRNRIAIVAGGAGFYLRALLHGLSPAPLRDERLRARLDRIAQKRPASLHFMLNRCDQAAAARIHPNDRQKLIRALEISTLARQAVSHVQSRPRAPLEGYAVLKIGLNPDRSELREQLARRAGRMFREGLLDETRQLLGAGYSVNSKAMQSVGYKQAMQVLAGQLPLQDAIDQCIARTRQYAKRQMTWFRAERDVAWLNGFGTEEDVHARALALARSHLVSSSEKVLSTSEHINSSR